MSHPASLTRPDARATAGSAGERAAIFGVTEALDRVGTAYRDGGWPAQVEGDALTAPFSAPSAGPPPWEVYRFTARTVVGVATREPYGATRWTF